MTVLCANPNCRPVEHGGPRKADHGAYLCLPCTTRIGENACAAATLWEELAHVIATTGGHGEKVSGSPAAGLPLNEAAAEARWIIRHTLTAWARHISVVRGFQPPRDYPTNIAEYIALNATWLAAQHAAGQAADELANAGREPRWWWIAYPAGTRVFQVAPCLVDGCDGVLMAVLRRDDDIPAELVCTLAPDNPPPNTPPEISHRWRSGQLVTLGRKLAKTNRDVA